MHILMVGISHHSADMSLRERLALDRKQCDQLLEQLRVHNRFVEAVFLCTCNRTEIYIARPELEAPKREQIVDALADAAGIAGDELSIVHTFRKQDDAVRHLFGVAAGLDSMVLGEPQILGQVKRAYDDANHRNAVGPILHRVFQEAIATARRARRETGIDQGRVSIGSIAVDFAGQIFDSFEDKTVLAVGAGEMAKLTLARFCELSPGKLILANRSIQRGEELRDSLLGRHRANMVVRPFDELDALLAEADVVITSTAAPHAVITQDRFKPIHRKRRAKPLFIVDIALPRDVDDAVGKFSNVYLYNIDDLRAVADENAEGRCAEVQACHNMINTAVRSTLSQIQNRDVGHLIRELRDQMRTIGDAEAERTLRKMSGLSGLATSGDAEQLERVLDEHTHRLINKILHVPLSQLNQRDGDAPLGFAAAALRHLFKLEGRDDPAASTEQPPADDEPAEPAIDPSPVIQPRPEQANAGR